MCICRLIAALAMNRVRLSRNRAPRATSVGTGAGALRAHHLAPLCCSLVTHRCTGNQPRENIKESRSARHECRDRGRRAPRAPLGPVTPRAPVGDDVPRSKVVQGPECTMVHRGPGPLGVVFRGPCRSEHGAVHHRGPATGRFWALFDAFLGRFSLKFVQKSLENPVAEL